jgi:HK97 family phage major capsid protein
MPKDEMDLNTVADAVVEVKRLFESFQEKAAEREKELMTKGAVDTLLEDSLTKINTAIEDQQKIIDELHTKNNRPQLLIDGKPADIDALDQKSHDWATMATAERGGKKMPETFGYEEMKAYGAAMQTWMREGKDALSADEIKALSVGSDSDGGYHVTPDTSGRMVKKIYETSAMRQHASVQVITTDSLNGTYDLEEGDAGWVSETGARSESDTPKVGVWDIPVHELYAMPKATQKLLDDAGVNIEDWLADKTASKMVRIENAAFVNGDGAGKPRGFLSYPSGTTNPGQIKRFGTGVDGDFAADPNGADKLLNMIYDLKDPYRTVGKFYMNRLTTFGVRLLKDSDGRPLWQPATTAGEPSTLLGQGVVNLEDMPDYTTTDALAVAFGDMAEAYQIVERQGTRVLRDPFTNKPYVLFYTTRRVGGDVVNFEALNLLEFTA